MRIQDLLAHNRSGQAVGLPSFCTSNMLVIDAALGYAAQHNLPILIEATCNQVNQFGGYTGMQPADFARIVRDKASTLGLPADNLILGGDHLGPNPWRDLPVAEAMEHACLLVQRFVEAGFTKIHLDASMACGGEPTPSFETVAARAAQLCQVAEAHAPDPGALSYIIGTEVPIPGGETEAMDGLQITSPARLDDTISTHKDAFVKVGLQDALDRVVSVVVQPGVDFSHTEVFAYEPDKAAKLIKQIMSHDNVTFEAHSTDYQKTAALAELVKDHHLFLKVGPELTFALREALFLLADIEDSLLGDTASGLKQVTFDAMAENPDDWANYYKGTPQEQEFLKTYSYSDRIRYYWDQPAVAAAIEKMVQNLDGVDLPPVVISQVFGMAPAEQNDETASSLITARVNYVVGRYYSACGFA